MSDLFDSPTYKDIRLSDMLEELEREIKVRRRVYPRWVENGKLDPVTADRRILCLVAIRKRLSEQEPTVRLDQEVEAGDGPGSG